MIPVTLLDPITAGFFIAITVANVALLLYSLRKQRKLFLGGLSFLSKGLSTEQQVSLQILLVMEEAGQLNHAPLLTKLLSEAKEQDMLISPTPLH